MKLKWGWGPFGDAVEPGKLSMTRLVAFMFAIVICDGIRIMARKDHLHDVGWPFVALGIVTLVAVPLQAFFKFFNTWLKTKPGAKLLEKLAERGASLIGISSDPKTTVNVNSPPAESS